MAHEAVRTDGDVLVSGEGPKKVVAADGHEYHKSATANATVAPTNEATLANAVKGANVLSEAELEFVTLVHYEWGLKGDYDPAFIKKEYGYSEQEFTDLITSTAVVKALGERGFPCRRLEAVEEATVKKAKLTPIQLIVANTMLDLADTRSTKKKLQDLGCTTATYQMWLRDENFSAYLRERAEALVGDVQHEAMLSLVDRVQSGDIKAIQYYHEITGRFVPQSANNGVGSSHDMQGMIVRIIEIIIDEVDDPQTALRISDRLKGLVTGAQIAGILPVEQVSVPEIAKARELTPQVRAMMDKGLGTE